MAMNTNTSFDFANIPNPKLIHSGSPALYQLTPKKKKFGTLKRMTLGTKDPNKPNKTILLVGETGAGKSTLINALVNYALGVNWEDNVWFQMVEDEKKSQAESQTSDVIVYEIFGFEGKPLPYSLTIIDTPGYGSTRGIEEDDIVSKRLLDLFSSEKGVHEIHVVGLVMKSTDNRLDERLSYIFESVVDLFGKDMEKHIVALITHSNGYPPTNVLTALKAAEIKCAEDENNQPVHFLFDNHQNEDRTKDEYGFEDRITMKGIKRFTEFLEKTEPEHLKTTVQVLNGRIRLTACIQNLLERVDLIEHKQTEIQQTQEGLKEHEEEMKKNENFTIEVDEPYKERKPIDAWWDTKATCCLKCEENCHYPGCTMAWDASWCYVMKDGRCISCTGKCPASDHVREKWRYETKTRKVKKTQEDIKKKYKNSKKESESMSSLLGNLEKEMEDLQRDKDQWLKESFNHLIKLEQIALNVDSISIHVYLDFLMEKMKEKGDEEKVQKLEEMKRRMDERPKSGLQYLVGRAAAAAGEAVKGAVNWKNTNTSFNFANPKLIQSGSPALYQLTPKKKKFGTLKRMTLGTKDPNRVNKTILLVGETGAGKSTLINALVNYALGVNWEDNVWFQMVEDEKKSQAESQTSDVIVYEIFGFEGNTLPYSLTIIDTPGYGNTEDIGQDVIISQRLLDLFKSNEGVYEINVVGLVMKASENRLSPRLRYVFDSVVSLFGNNIQTNIVALITHSDGVTPENVLTALKDAEIKCATDEDGEPVHFLFNNHQSKQKTKKNKGGLKHAWDFTKEEMGEFTEFLRGTAPEKLMTTIEVLKARVKLQGSIQDLKERVEMVELKQKEIQQTQEGLKKHEEEMKNNQQFTIEVDEPYKERVIINAWWDTKATCCLKCEENCHYPGCTGPLGPSWCDVMKDGRCTSCTGKCPVSDHVREKWRYETKTRKVKKTQEYVKAKYENSKAEGVSLLESLEKEKEKLQRKSDSWLEKSFQLLLQLDEIALNVNAVSTHVHLDFLIEKMKEKGDEEKVQKLEEMKSKSGMRYKFGRAAAAAGKAVKGAVNWKWVNHE